MTLTWVVMSILSIHAYRGNPWAYSWPALNTNGFFRVNKEILIMFKSWGFFLVKKFINCPCSLRSVFFLLVYTKIMDGVEGVIRWATQTVNIFQYSPLRNARGICDGKYYSCCRNERVKSSFCAFLPTRLSTYKHNGSPQCQRLLVDIYP